MEIGKWGLETRKSKFETRVQFQFSDFQFPSSGFQDQWLGWGCVCAGAGGGAGEGDSSSSEKQPSTKKPGTSRKSINLRNLRIFCSNPDSGEYRISFDPEFDGPGFLSVKIVGEVGEDSAPIKSAQMKDSEKEIDLPSEGQIGPVDLKRGQRNTLQIMLSEPLRCALEVSAHAN